MDGYELFQSGVSFNDFVNTDTGSYREKTLEIFDTMEIDDDLLNKIKSIDRKINVLICAEMWCPDCMINVLVVEKMRT